MVGRMPRRFCGAIIPGSVFLSAWLLVADPAVARVSDLCVGAGQKAATRFGVPYPVLHAIMLVETGRGYGSTTKPWPWTLNIAGHGYWLESKEAALTAAAVAISEGERRVDHGCFQINYRWHGMHFSSIEQMLDPDAGAAYAAQFLQRLYLETGDWSKAAGAYHSRTPLYAARYRARFDRYLDASPQADQDSLTFLPRANTFPWLQTGDGMAVMGSLLPMSGARNP